MPRGAEGGTSSVDSSDVYVLEDLEDRVPERHELPDRLNASSGSACCGCPEQLPSSVLVQELEVAPVDGLDPAAPVGSPGGVAALGGVDTPSNAIFRNEPPSFGAAGAAHCGCSGIWKKEERRPGVPSGVVAREP